MDKLLMEQKAQLALVGSHIGEGPGDDKKQRLALPPAPRSHKEVLILHDAAVGWPGGPTLMSGVNLKVSHH